MLGKKEAGDNGFLWGIILGILGLIFFPFLRKGLNDLGVVILKEGVEEEIETLREKIKNLEKQLGNQQNKNQ